MSFHQNIIAFIKAFWLLLGQLLLMAACIAFFAGLIWLTFMAICFVLWAMASILGYSLITIANIFTYTCRAVNYLCERLTFTACGVGWKSIKIFADSRTPLLSQTRRQRVHHGFTTCALCPDCYKVVDRSKLLSGSFIPLVKRREFHNWTFPLRGQQLADSACHLCRILWFSIKEETRESILVRYRDLLGRGGPLFAGIVIYKEPTGGWFGMAAYSLQVCYSDGMVIGDKLTVAEEIMISNHAHPPSAVVSLSTGSTHSLATTSSWISQCHSNHYLHCKTRRAYDGNSYLPTRLLYIGNGDLRLVETSNADLPVESHDYVALSYCTGEDGVPSRHKLTANNKEAWKKSINRRTLPLTFQEAITATRRLGIKYLWIDVLCILDDDIVDRKRELSNMGRVYSHAFCSISACRSTDIEDGLFLNRDRSFRNFPCYLRFSGSRGLVIRANEDAYSRDSFSREVDQSLWNNNARACQVRLLSPCTLHFGARFLFFECNTLRASEVFPQGELYGNKKQTWSIFRGRSDHSGVSGSMHLGHNFYLDTLRNYKATSLNTENEATLHQYWFRLVLGFSTTVLNEPADRIDCIKGIAEYISSGEHRSEYIHGLWSRHFIFDLLWYVWKDNTDRPKPERAPTWSWQSVDGAVGEYLVSRSSRAVGESRSLLKLADILPSDSGQEINASSQFPRGDVLTLRGRVLSGVDFKTTSLPVCSLTVTTRYENAEASFWHDASDFDCSRELFCVELIREVFFEKKDNQKIIAVWSNGIVLQRTGIGRPDRPVYNRVGRFWMNWPAPASGSVMGNKDTAILFDRSKPQVVRVV